ncbi:MAG: FKBP-type peptidyl-prolyl cis-trans isomerase [candidate division WOR-3 bacterium]
MTELKVEKGKYVKFEYELYLADNDQLVDAGVVDYCHGNGEIFPKLERALEGASVGDILDITLSPQDAFGEFDRELVKEIPLDYFEDKDVKPGQILRAQTVDGTVFQFTVLDVKDNIVYADFNHPLAGETVRFKIRILEINDEKPEGGCCCGGGCGCS